MAFPLKNKYNFTVKLKTEQTSSNRQNVKYRQKPGPKHFIDRFYKIRPEY